MKYAILILLLLSAPACASGQWGLLVVHHDGAVVITHGLNRNDCERARARVLGIPFTDAEKKAAAAETEKTMGSAAEENRSGPITVPGTIIDRFGHIVSINGVPQGPEITSAECFQ